MGMTSYSKLKNLPLYKGQDYTGAIFGRWTVLGLGECRRRPGTSSYVSNWLCRCECGTEKEVNKYWVFNQSSGCRECTTLKLEHNPLWKGYKEIPGTVLQKLRWSAKKRSRLLELDIDCEYLYDLWINQNRKCVYSKRPLEILKTASVDRIDSSKGYIKGNVQWVHVDINRAKWELNSEQFVKLCKDVAENN